MEYPVIHFKSPSKSFSWNDGFFAIIKTEDDVHHMCKIDDKGLPMYYDDGGMMITCTGVRNEGISKTNLKLVVSDPKNILLTRADLIRGKENIHIEDVNIYDFKINRQQINKADTIDFVDDDGRKLNFKLK